MPCLSFSTQFMVNVDEEAVNDDQDMSRSQKLVLRHLNVLLGYNQKERAFSVPPYKLRLVSFLILE